MSTLLLTACPDSNKTNAQQKPAAPVTVKPAPAKPTDKGRCVQIFALHTLKLFLMYTLPYLCIRFMGLPCGLRFWQVQLLASLMLFLSNALPNVAGMGSIETAFLLVFGSFMTRGEAMSTLMLFRIASYYFVFGFSAVASLFAQKHLDQMDAQK